MCLLAQKVNLTRAQESGMVVPPLAITPGTYFMQDVHDSLQYYICQRLIGPKFNHLQFELSGSTVKVRSNAYTPLLASVNTIWCVHMLWERRLCGHLLRIMIVRNDLILLIYSG